jgi:hypothetical protein
MKKQIVKSLRLKKTLISNLEKKQISGGLGSLDSQVSCYGSCLPNNTCAVGCKYKPVPYPFDPIPLPQASVFYWQCPEPNN